MTIKDPARVAALLDIVEKQSKGHPGFVFIGSEASAELREINEHIRKKHLEEKHQSITPAPVGEDDASKPTEASIDAKTPVPPVDKTRQEEEAKRIRAEAQARQHQDGKPTPVRNTYEGVPGPAEMGAPP